MSRQNLFLILLLVSAGLVNLIGIFGPELGFDALWYHLTIPKLYLSVGKIYHIPGGLLYYSELPRLTEILYLPLLKYLGDFWPHLLSWGSGIGSAIIIYKLARKFLTAPSSLLTVVLFYATPLVGWQSGSSYIDLFRSLFEVLALYLVFSKKPILAGLTLGLAISTKTLALGSLVPLTISYYLITRSYKEIVRFLLITCFVALPWFLSAYLNTGYPLYPIGAGILDPTHNLNSDFWNVTKILGDFWKLWLSPEDPISPIYLIATPFIVLSFKKFSLGLKLSTLYFLTSTLIWYVTPRTGGGRFILPYLPAFAILAGATIEAQKEKWFKNFLIATVIVISVINVGYRMAAQTKLLPYFFGRETKTDYLCRNLDLKVTYVNCAGTKYNGLVYVKGYHNLYYIDFPFVHETWYRGEPYNYVISP